jgi:hypothetical protein
MGTDRKVLPNNLFFVARNILQTVANENFKDANGSIWVLSDVSEPQKTILIEHTIEKGWNTSGIIKFMVSSLSVSSPHIVLFKITNCRAGNQSKASPSPKY